MKRILTLILSVFILLTIYTPMQVYGQDVEFNIDAQDITAEIRSDGSVQFTDIQYYDVDYMNGAIFTLDAEGYNLSNYDVGIIDPETNETDFFIENSTGSAETYQVSQSGGTYEFRVFYPSEDEEVAFVYQYTLDGLVTNYFDTAELNRKIIGENTDHRMDVTAEIILPAVVNNQEDFRTWAQGAPQGDIQQIERGGHSIAVINVPNNPSNQFVEVQILFPTALTPNNTNVVDENHKEEVIANQEEERLAELENFEQNRNIRIYGLFALMFLVPVLPIIALVYYFSRRRKLNPNPVHVPEHVYHLPEDITPAIMATSVFRNQPTPDDLTATIVDLARKGFIEIEEVRKEKRGFFSGESSTARITIKEDHPDLNTLQKHEKYAFEFLTPESGQNSFTLEEMEEKISKSNTYRKQQNSLWTRFVNFTTVVGTQKKGKQKEQQTAILLAVFSNFIPVIAIVFGAVIAFTEIDLSNYYWILLVVAVIGIGISIYILILVIVRPILTTEQDKRRKEWKGFSNMLDDIGNFNMREIASLTLWEEFLVYAISLGVADKVVEAMNIEFSATEMEQLAMGPTIYHHPYLFTGMIGNSVNQSVTTSSPSSNYSGSNSSGFGGGFGGGSSGGSGGGSGSGGF